MPDVYDGTQTSDILVLSFTSGTPVDISSQIFGGTMPQIVCPSGLFIADFNGDGRSDIFVSDTGVDFNPWPGASSTSSSADLTVA